MNQGAREFGPLPTTTTTTTPETQPDGNATRSIQLTYAVTHGRQGCHDVGIDVCLYGTDTGAMYELRYGANHAPTHALATA